MLDEERLCGLSQMGFHVNCCLYVSLINVFMLNACMLWISRYEDVSPPLFMNNPKYVCVASLIERICDKAIMLNTAICVDW